MQRSHHRTRSAIALIAAVLTLLAVVGPVAAGSPKPVTIVSHVTFNPDGPNFGDFDASGAAAGCVVCPKGTFVDTSSTSPDSRATVVSSSSRSARPSPATTAAARSS